MTRTLLVRGMLAGAIAGLLVFALARWIGEPQVDRAITFESSMEHAGGHDSEPEIVSRRIQRGLGLLTGTTVYGAAIGGIFGLVFAFAQGRVNISSPRTLAALLAAMGFIAVALVPMLKYPANPPSVGNPETIGIRTAAFFLFMLSSLAILVLSLQAGRRLGRRVGAWNGYLAAAVLFILLMSALAYFLPAFDEVPAGFSATLLWKFRVAAIEMQALLWASIGLLFGWLTERNQA